MINRGTIFTTALAAIVAPVSARTAFAQATVSRITAYAFSFPALAGRGPPIPELSAPPLVVVHTESLFGHTTQHSRLTEVLFALPYPSPLSNCVRATTLN